MAYKQLLFRSAAREKILRGATQLAEAVRITLGPKSKSVESAGNMGFDAARKQYVDLIEAGIVDPTKVVRIALQNAVSVASILLLTEATLTEKPEHKKEPASPVDTEA